jgi:outer membrane protein
MRLRVLWALALIVFAGGAGASAQGQVLTLEQAVTTALESSYDLRDARMGLEVAEEQVSEAWSLLYPTIDASAGYTRNLSVASNFLPAVIFDPEADPSELIPVRFGSDNVWTTSINIEQPLFKPGVFVGVGAASRFKNFERENVRGRTQAVVTRVRVSYYSLLLAQEQTRLVQNSVDRVRQSLDETEALNKAGLAADYDVLRLQVELANLEPNLLRARNAVSQSERELSIELGSESSDQIRVAGSLADIDLDDRAANSPENRQILAFSAWVDEEGVSPEGLQNMAQNDRSDLRSLDLMEQLRQSEMKLEQVQYLPEIVLFGTYAITAQENGSPDFFGESSMQRAYARQAGVRVTWPLFSGFSKDARIDQKRASLRQAQAQTRLARSRAESEVETLWDQVGEARERAGGQRLAVRQANRGFEIASAQYREGLGSQLELTDSEVALRQSEFNYAQAVYDFLVAQANLDQAVGFVPLVDSNDASGPVE